MLDYLVAGVYIESKIDPSTVSEGAGTRPEDSRERRIAREVQVTKGLIEFHIRQMAGPCIYQYLAAMEIKREGLHPGLGKLSKVYHLY